MPVNPVNLARVTQNLRADLLIESVRRTQRDLLSEQARIATGRSFVSGSEDPVAAARTLQLTDLLARDQQFSANLRHGDNNLAASDTALNEVAALIREAQTIASQDVSNLTSADERLADAELIAGIRRQLQAVGNRFFDGRFLFAGRATTSAPFVDAFGGIAYVGDTGYLRTRVQEGASDPVNVPGNMLYGSLTGRIAGSVDLTPNLTESTRITDLQGATARGIRPGTLVITRANAPAFTVDLSDVDTIGDVANRINAAAGAVGSGVTATVTDAGLDIDPHGESITVVDVGTGTVAADLGILTRQATTALISGGDLGPRVTMLTPISELKRGGTIDLAGGLTVTNGPRSAVIDLSNAQTVQDIINAINGSGLHIRAAINPSGTGLDVYNEVSGTALTIAENSGTTAGDLGLRTLHGGALLSFMNFGRGIGLDPAEDDLRIQARDGSTVDVNLDGAVTLQDVIDAINTAAQAANVNITASLNAVENGLRIDDATGGTGALGVISLHQSTAAVDLGFTAADPSATSLVGADPSGIRVESVLGALVELESALRRDDTQGISLAAERLVRFQEESARVHGMVGARAQAMRARLDQTLDASRTNEIHLSEIRDLDYAESITELQTMQTTLQANLQVSSTLLNLSLLDFLR